MVGYRAYLEKKYKAEFESRWANVEGTRAVHEASRRGAARMADQRRERILLGLGGNHRVEELRRHV